MLTAGTNKQQNIVLLINEFLLCLTWWGQYSNTVQTAEDGQKQIQPGMINQPLIRITGYFLV